MINFQRAPRGEGSAKNLGDRLRQAKAPAIAAGLLVASLLTAAASALWAPPPPTASAAARTTGRAAEAAADNRLRSLSYYPEQLAALNSLSHFEPMADSGRPSPPTPVPFPRPTSFVTALATPVATPLAVPLAVPLAAPLATGLGKSAPLEGKPHRIAVAARIGAIAGLAVAPPATPTAAAPAQAPLEQAAGPLVFGVRLPAMPSLPALPGVEAASSNILGFGAQIAKLWH